MLFLLNARVLDLAEPGETLARLGQSLREAPVFADVARLARESAFAADGIEGLAQNQALSLACLFALATDANAALLVRPEGARSPADVALRVAVAPLPTLVYLRDRQMARPPDPAEINAYVWRAA